MSKSHSQKGLIVNNFLSGTFFKANAFENYSSALVEYRKNGRHRYGLIEKNIYLEHEAHLKSNRNNFSIGQHALQGRIIGFANSPLG